MISPQLLFSLALSILMLGILYWVIRLAVRHAIEDADHRRANERH